MNIRKLCSLLVALGVAVALLVSPGQQARAEQVASIAITSPTTGKTIAGQVITVTGTSSNVSELHLVVGAQELVPITAAGSDGTWRIDLDVSQKHGRLDLAVRGRNLSTLYTAWSSFITVTVTNVEAARPTITIVSPTEGRHRSHLVLPVAKVESTHPVRRVEFRVNGGHWRPAFRALGRPGHHQAVFWVPGTTFISIEARATDTLGHVSTAPTIYIALGRATKKKPQMYHQDRAIWIWERAAYEAVFSAAARDRLGAVLDDTTTFNSDPIKTIYLGVDRHKNGQDMLRDSRRQVADFVRWARARGYRVQATVAGGTQPPYLGALPQFQHFAIDEFEKVLNYNLSVSEDARFDGVNVDIEPYILGEWKQPGNTLPTTWLEILEKLIARRDASGLPLLVGPAIPRWLDTSPCCNAVTWKGVTKPVSEHIQDMADYISIMDYRDTADGNAGIIAQAENEIAYAIKINKPNSVVIGIETKDLSGTGDPETVTFWEEGRAHLEKELDKVYTAFGNKPSFGGVAMHHFDSLLMLPASWDTNSPVYYPVPGAGPHGPEMPT